MCLYQLHFIEADCVLGQCLVLEVCRLSWERTASELWIFIYYIPTGIARQVHRPELGYARCVKS